MSNAVGTDARSLLRHAYSLERLLAAAYMERKRREAEGKTLLGIDDSIRLINEERAILPLNYRQAAIHQLAASWYCRDVYTNGYWLILRTAHYPLKKRNNLRQKFSRASEIGTKDMA